MPFIILDRDGVINYESTEYIKAPDEWKPIPGSLAAIAQLNHAGFRVLVATNQSGVARGFYTIEMLNRIHEKMLTELAVLGGSIEEIFFCPHHPDEGCLCRKPKAGMLRDIEKKYPLTLKDTFFIGDSFVDVCAAQEVGCRPILVLTGNGELALERHPELKEIPYFENLSAAVLFVLSEKKDL